MAKEGDIELVHITKVGVLHHVLYRAELRRYGIYWLKVIGSEKPCCCPERNTDRLALLGIASER